MFIYKFMTTDVVALDGDACVGEARMLMIRHRFRHIPVIRPDKTIAGIVSDRDIRSAMGDAYFHERKMTPSTAKGEREIPVREIMTKDPVCISHTATIQDALLLIEKTRVGAFPVVDEHRQLIGMVSDRDLLNAFIQVLGIREPGCLIGIVIDKKIDAMEKIIHALITENIHFGSILVYRNWKPDKWVVFPYLLSKNVIHFKHKLRDMGYEWVDPIDWQVAQQGETSPGL
jgi:acetoin utilization protein AcuB